MSEPTITQVLEGAVADGAAPGFCAGAVRGDGTVLFEGAVGVRGTESGEPMTPDTVFRIFSMTKAVASVAAAILVEEGRLDIETPVDEVVADFAAVEVLEGFDGATPVLRPPATRATVRHLATHTSGLVYELWNANQEAMMAAGAPGALTGSVDALKSSYKLAFDPGTAWDYGVGIDWLGLVVEAVSGQSLDRFVTERILEPLAMTSSGFERDGFEDRLVPLHVFGPDGSISEMPDIAPPPNPEFYGGGHAMFSTAGDYLRFLRMLLNGGELEGQRVLAAETLDWVFANQIGDLEIGTMTSVGPLSADVDFLPGVAKKHSFAFVTNTEDMPGMRRAGAQSWAGLANTHMWVDPAADVAAVLCAQVLPFAHPGVMKAYAEFEQAVYREL